MNTSELKSCLKFMYRRYKNAGTKVIAENTAVEAAAMIDHTARTAVSLDRAAVCMEAAHCDEPPENIIKIAQAMYVGKRNGPIKLPVEDMEIDFEDDSSGLKTWCKSETGDTASKSSFDFYSIVSPGTWAVGCSYGQAGSESKYLVYRVGAYLCADWIETETRVGKKVRKHSSKCTE